jgi:phage shock protein PspC (stress-responsive transcriptional regulator)
MLQLDKDHAVIAGVCAGLANSTGISVGVIRFMFVAYVLLWGVGLVPYLVLWLIMYLNGKNN